MRATLRAFRQGLKETGYVEGQNVAIEYRWAEGQYDRLPALAAELVRRRVAVIVATEAQLRLGQPKLRPRRYPSSSRQRRSGQARSRHQPQPAGRQRDWNQFFQCRAGGTKRLALLHELVPRPLAIAVLVDPANAANTEATSRRGTGCARARAANPVLKRQHQSRDRRGLRKPCARASRCAIRRSDPFFISRRDPNWSRWRRAMRCPRSTSRANIAEVGGLMSYGTSLPDAYRQVGVYAGRILKGDKPADLPVMQSTKFEFVINLQDRQGARPHGAADAARARRRGDRIRAGRCCICSRPLVGH